MMHVYRVICYMEVRTQNRENELASLWAEMGMIRWMRM